MKTLISIILFAGLVACGKMPDEALQPSASVGPWQAKLLSVGFAVNSSVTEADGTVVLLGDNATLNQFEVYASHDGGATFAQIHQPDGTPEDAIAPINAVIDPVSGEIFVGGVGRVSPSSISWVIRKSSDHGVTWQNVETYSSSSNLVTLYGLARSDSGALYAAGTGQDTAGNSVSIVRKSTDQGASWVTVFQRGDFNLMDISVRAADAGDEVYVTGMATRSCGGVSRSSGYSACTFRSGDGGQNWSNVSMNLPAQANGVSFQLRINPQTGSKFAVAESSDFSSGTSGYILRSPDGINWETVYFYNNQTASASLKSFVELSSLVISPSGTIYASGRYSDQAGDHAFMVYSRDDGASWQRVDDLTFQGQSIQIASGTLMGGVFKMIAHTGQNSTQNLILF